MFSRSKRLLTRNLLAVSVLVAMCGPTCADTLVDVIIHKDGSGHDPLANHMETDPDRMRYLDQDQVSVEDCSWILAYLHKQPYPDPTVTGAVLLINGKPYKTFTALPVAPDQAEAACKAKGEKAIRWIRK